MANKSDTQQRILDAAIEVFASKGFHGATTSEIAKAASVAEGTIFKYYKTKKLLLHGVLEHIIHEVVPSIMKQSFEEVQEHFSCREPKTVVKELMLRKAEQINQNINCMKIVINEMQYHEDIKGEYIGKLVPSFIKTLEDAYALGVKKGVFRDIEAHTAVRSFMGMFGMMMLEKNVLNAELDISSELDKILDIYLNGVIEKGEAHV